MVVDDDELQASIDSLDFWRLAKGASRESPLVSGFCGCLANLCLCKLSFWAKVASHWVHENLLPSCLLYLWRYAALLVPKLLPQPSAEQNHNLCVGASIMAIMVVRVNRLGCPLSVVAMEDAHGDNQ